MSAARVLGVEAVCSSLKTTKFRLFDGLDDKSLRLLAGALTERVFQEDEVLLRVGDASQKIFFILDGIVKVELPLIASNSLERIATLQEGNTAGEFALVRQGKITAQVTAINQVRVLATTRYDIERIVSENPGVGCRLYFNLGTILVDRLVDTNLLARNVLSQISIY